MGSTKPTSNLACKSYTMFGSLQKYGMESKGLWCIFSSVSESYQKMNGTERNIILLLFYTLHLSFS